MVYIDTFNAIDKSLGLSLQLISIRIMAKSSGLSSSKSPLSLVLNGVLVVVVILLGAKLYMTTKMGSVQQGVVEDTVKLPATAVKITECLPHMGDHWVEPANIPLGPYYVTYQGKVLGMEYMINPEEIPGNTQSRMQLPEFEKFLANNNLTLGDYMKEFNLSLPLQPLTYRSVHMHWSPPHPGFVVPHYDIHFYLVSDEELDAVCPNARIEDAYSPEVLETINKNNIPFPGQ